jgi:peptide/nickel transport system ATP-binding protein
MAEPLLEIRDLVTEFRTEQGVVRAVDGVSFEIPARATLGSSAPSHLRRSSRPANVSPASSRPG